MNRRQGRGGGVLALFRRKSDMRANGFPWQASHLPLRRTTNQRQQYTFRSAQRPIEPIEPVVEESSEAMSGWTCEIDWPLGGMCPLL